MNSSPLRLMAIIWLPFIIIGALCIYSGFVVSPTAMTEGGFPVHILLWIMGAIFVVFPLLLLVIIIGFFIGTDNSRQKLKAKGLHGHAFILQMSQTGSYLNNDPEICFRLKVHLPGQSVFMLEHNEYVPLIKLGSFSVGQEVQVYADQHNHKKLIIDQA